MVKVEWGTKRTCQNCGSRFYDLRRSPILCPLCNAVYDPERQPKVRRGSSALRDEPVLAGPRREDALVGAALDEELLEDDVADDEAEEDGEGDGDDLNAEDRSLVVEDTSDLGADSDDIGEVMEHVDDELDDKV